MRPAQRFYVSPTREKGVYQIALGNGNIVVDRAPEPLRDLADFLTKDRTPKDTPLEIYYLGRDDMHPTRPTFVTLETLVGSFVVEDEKAAEPVAKPRRRTI